LKSPETTDSVGVQPTESKVGFCFGVSGQNRFILEKILSNLNSTINF